MAKDAKSGGIDRRRFLIAGGAGAGLLVAWALWPRAYEPNLVAAPGETVFNAFLKIGEDGHVTVVVPQAEMGQGVYTTLPQILADELGADWRTIAVEPAPINPLYANRLIAEQWGEALAPGFANWAADDYATRSALMITAGSTSVRAFEAPMREAGAAARALLCQAAAERWEVDWEACDTEAGFVVHEGQRLRIGELAGEAAGYEVPDPVPLRVSTRNRLTGRSLPRLDLPSKIDGSANFAGDVRLPRMVYAAIRQGPPGSQLVHVDPAVADRIPGVMTLVETPGWIAAVANNWWAANRALTELAPRFVSEGPLADDASIETALAAALDEGDGARIESSGDLSASFEGATIHVADYSVGAGVHAAIEPMTATADWSNDRLELWLPTQAPGAARAAAARAVAIDPALVTIHPMLIGGSFGRKLESDAAVQAAILAKQLKRPVQLVWSRAEDIVQDRFRPPAQARLAARLGQNGAIDGWLAKVAAPSAGRAVAARLLEGETIAGALVAGGSDATAVAGALPPYAIANLAVDHHPAEIGIPSGAWRSGAHSYTAFFTESFIDELAAVAAIDPFSYRMSKLGGSPRLARCLSTAAALGGWRGGGAGTGQGIACHSSRGSHVAVLAEARIGPDRRIAVDRLVAVADVGRVINPNIVRQQIEGGVVFGIASALGASTGFEGGIATARTLADLRLPILADMPEMTVELVASEAEPGGVSEVAVPPVAPAIANALFASTGQRFRRLPIALGR